MTKKNRGVQIMAFLALFGIIIGIIGTGLLIIFSGSNTTEQTLTPEQYLELQKYLDTQSGSVDTNSGVVIEMGTGSQTLTGEIK